MYISEGVKIAEVTENSFLKLNEKIFKDIEENKMFFLLFH